MFILVVACVFSSWIAAPSARAATYMLRVLPFCYTPSCGYESDDDFRQAMSENLQELNRRWTPMGISFSALIESPNIENHFSKLMNTKTGEIHEETFQQLRNMASARSNLITLFVIEDNGYDFSPVPQDNPDPKDQFGIFTLPFADGEVWSHEMGHYFCLHHTHTFQDPADFHPVSHDGDQIADTPDDPGPIELKPSFENEQPDLLGGNIDRVTGAYDPNLTVEDHEWCDITFLNPENNWLGHTPPDPDSPSQDYCLLQCKRKKNGKVIDTDYKPLPQLEMSYYGDRCAGPLRDPWKALRKLHPGEIKEVHWCQILPTRRCLATFAGQGRRFR